MAEDQNQENQTEETGAEGEGEESGGSKLPLILMLAGVLVLGAGIGAGVFLMLSGGDEEPAAGLAGFGRMSGQGRAQVCIWGKRGDKRPCFLIAEKARPRKGGQSRAEVDGIVC